MDGLHRKGTGLCAGQYREIGAALGQAERMREKTQGQVKLLALHVDRGP